MAGDDPGSHARRGNPRLARSACRRGAVLDRYAFATQSVRTWVPTQSVGTRRRGQDRRTLLASLLTLAQRCRPIELLILDVDGVLTPGGIVYGDTGFELKAFHVRDGSG